MLQLSFILDQSAPGPVRESGEWRGPRDLCTWLAVVAKLFLAKLVALR